MSAMQGLFSVFSKVSSIGGVVLGNPLLRAVSVTTFFMLILLAGAISDSFEQNTPEPFIDELGNFLIKNDLVIKQSVDSILSDDNSMYSNFKLWMRLLGSMWIMYILAKIVFKLTLAWNDSAQVQGYVFGILFLMAIQVTFYAIRFHEFYIPFQGVWHFVTHIPALIGKLPGDIFKVAGDGVDRYADNNLTQVMNNTNVSTL